MRIAARCSESCVVAVDLSIGARAGRRLGLARPRAFAVAHGAGRVTGAGSTTVRVRPTRRARRALAHARGVLVTVSAKVSDLAGNRARLPARRVRLRA